MQENMMFKIKGSMTNTLTKENGDIETYFKDNIIVSTGFDFICDAICNASQTTKMSYIAIGTGATVAAISNTGLVTELIRQAAVYAHTAGTQIFTLTTTFAPGVATGALTEAGVLNLASAGVLFDRVVFSVINKASGDTLVSTFTFTLS